MVKTVNLAYQGHLPEQTEPSAPVIEMHTNEQLLRERMLLETPVLPLEKPVYEKIKRFSDIICAVSAMTILSPVFVLTAVLIVADDFGSPFYTQERIGKDGKPFRIYKFRSMYLDADERRKELLALNEGSGATFKMKKDPRITRIGSFIRRTSIDELPQLLNILKGDMSVIGPRPFIPSEQANLPDDRLSVVPGLSCYWQIGGKNELSLAQQIALDRKYIKERSLLTDVKIIFRTILHVLTGKNC